jgi:hypothetical protein
MLPQSVEINIDEYGFGTTLIDGKPIHGIRSFTIHSSIGDPGVELGLTILSLDIITKDLKVRADNTAVEVHFVCPRCNIHVEHECLP